MRRLTVVMLICLVSLLAAGESWDWTASYPDRSLVETSTTYEVGPGRSYANPRDVPWLDLRPGDEVLIHHRSAPYTDMVFIGAQGAPGRWITIRGVPGPGGERPVFDGSGAVMPSGTGGNAYTQSAGMFIVCKPTGYAYGYKPSYIHITGLCIRNVRSPARITDMYGADRAWGDFVAGIYVSPGDHIAITDCEIADCSNGLFVNSQDAQYSQSRSILVRGNYFHGNGMVGQASMHNAYTEAIGTVYEHNYFAAPVVGTGGDNIKERSAGIIFRYNYIEDGVNLISLRDPQSNAVYEAEAVDHLGGRLASQAYIYGNILAARNPTVYQDAPVIVAHGDGIYGDGRHVRDGSISFYGNRVVSTLDVAAYHLDSVPLFCLINTRAPTTVVAVNNLFYAASHTEGGVRAELALFYWQGIADWTSNWANAFRSVRSSAADGGLAVGTRFDGTGLGGLGTSPADPGFVDPAAANWLTTPASPFATLSAPWPSEAVARALVPQDQPVVVPFGAGGASADTTPPAISAVSAGTPTASAATITWTTDEAASTQVEYGATTAYGSTTGLVATLTTSHGQAVTGLAAATTYHYRVLSRDGAGNLATSADGTFTTAVDPHGGGSGDEGSSCGAGAAVGLLLAGPLAALRRRRHEGWR